MNRNAAIGLGLFVMVPIIACAIMVGAFFWEKPKGLSNQSGIGQARSGPIVVATKAIEEGSTIKSTDVKEQLGTSRQFLQSPDAVKSAWLITGRTAKEKIEAGEVITVEDLDSPKLDKTQKSAAAKNDSDVNNIVGKYSGTCSDQLVAVAFKTSDKGKLSAHYLFQTDDNERFEGVLDNLVLSKNQLTSTWHDKFGTGSAHFVFNKDFTEFTGDWRNDSDKESDEPGDWNGVKCADD